MNVHREKEDSKMRKGSSRQSNTHNPSTFAQMHMQSRNVSGAKRQSNTGSQSRIGASPKNKIPRIALKMNPQSPEVEQINNYAK